MKFKGRQASGLTREGKGEGKGRKGGRGWGEGERERERERGRGDRETGCPAIFPQNLRTCRYV